MSFNVATHLPRGSVKIINSQSVDRYDNGGFDDDSFSLYLLGGEARRRSLRRRTEDGTVGRNAPGAKKFRVLA